MNTNHTTIEQLKAAATEFKDIRKEVEKAIISINPVELVTPTNVAEVKSNWIKQAKAGNFEDPVFTYDLDLLSATIDKRPELKVLRDKLDEMRPNPSNLAATFVWEQLYHAVKDALDTTFLAECIRDHNDEDSGKFVRDKYGVPGDLTCSNALTIALNNLSAGRLETDVRREHELIEEDDLLLREKKLNAQIICQMLSWAMNQYRIPSWQIDISNRYSSIDVRDKSSFGYPIIAIPEKREVTGYKMAELIGHEIECHWRSSINAESIGALKCDDELVYEGLAALKDKQFNRAYLGSFNLNSVYYVLAMKEALEAHSFSKVAKLIYGYIPEGTQGRVTKAWMYTYRVFRGITDTRNSAGYAFTKDRAYFEGYVYALELQKKGLEGYLNFSTLPLDSFKRFMEITTVEDVVQNSLGDAGAQQRSIEKMLKCLRYGNTQAAELVNRI